MYPKTSLETIVGPSVNATFAATTAASAVLVETDPAQANARRYPSKRAIRPALSCADCSQFPWPARYPRGPEIQPGLRPPGSSSR